MERNRKRAKGRRRMRAKPVPKVSGGKFFLRVFCSVLLILAAIFIKQNAPQMAVRGRETLSVWTVSLPSF